jgi:hypothetical protein
VIAFRLCSVIPIPYRLDGLEKIMKDVDLFDPIGEQNESP